MSLKFLYIDILFLCWEEKYCTSKKERNISTESQKNFLYLAIRQWVSNVFIWLLYRKGWLEINFLCSIFFWLKDKKIKEMNIAISLIFQEILRHNSKKCQVPSDLYLTAGLHCQHWNYHHTTNFFRPIMIRHKLEKNMTESWISNTTKMYPVFLLTKRSLALANCLSHLTLCW